MILALAARELRALYTTPLAWLVLAGGQLILAWLFLTQLEVYQKIEPQLSVAGSVLGLADLVVMPTLNSAGLLLLLAAPLFGLQGIAAERRDGRIALLLSAPVAPLTLAVGKWLGQWLALLPLLLLALLTVGSLWAAAPLDPGRLATSALGLALFAAMAAAASLWLSSLGSHPAAAAAAAYGLLFLLWLLDSGGRDAPWQWFALTPHLSPSLKGLLRFSDLAYFGGLTTAALALTAHRLWQLRGGR